jgi:hypothetical protein
MTTQIRSIWRGATLLFLLAAWPTLADAAQCDGTTEERLRCHSEEVKDLLRDWVRAWGNGDIDAYLGLYTSIRSPRDDMTRSEWLQHRRERVSPDRPVEINLKLESMGLEDSGIFDVVFRQQYISPNYQDEVRKRLFLLREGDELKIWKEEVLP